MLQLLRNSQSTLYPKPSLLRQLGWVWKFLTLQISKLFRVKELAFVQKYGPTVMAAPTTTGFNRVAWIMPFVALTGGLLLVVVIVKAWNTRRAVAVVPAGGATVDAHELDELRRRVHQETEL